MRTLLLILVSLIFVISSVSSYAGEVYSSAQDTSNNNTPVSDIDYFFPPIGLNWTVSVSCVGYGTAWAEVRKDGGIRIGYVYVSGYSQSDFDTGTYARCQGETQAVANCQDSTSGSYAYAYAGIDW